MNLTDLIVRRNFVFLVFISLPAVGAAICGYVALDLVHIIVDSVVDTREHSSYSFVSGLTFSEKLWFLLFLLLSVLGIRQCLIYAVNTRGSFIGQKIFSNFLICLYERLLRLDALKKDKPESVAVLIVEARRSLEVFLSRDIPAFTLQILLAFANMFYIFQQSFWIGFLASVSVYFSLWISPTMQRKTHVVAKRRIVKLRKMIDNVISEFGQRSDEGVTAPLRAPDIFISAQRDISEEGFYLRKREEFQNFIDNMFLTPNILMVFLIVMPFVWPNYVLCG